MCVLIRKVLVCCMEDKRRLAKPIRPYASVSTALSIKIRSGDRGLVG